MRVMVAANSNKKCIEYAEKHPDGFGMIYSPQYWKNPPIKSNIRYALDNGCFSQFNENLFLKVLAETSQMENKPLWVVCPDVLGCNDRTLALWEYYHPIIKPYGHKIAFVAQNGCEPRDVPEIADIVFIGGLDPWKMDNAYKFIGDRPVHVGRRNELWMLEYCQEIGVESCDGSGWFRGGMKSRQACDLNRWFEGNPQRKLF